MTRASKEDSCGGTLCPNGILVVLPAQILLVAATVLSAMAAFDCKYVEADIGNMTLIPEDLVGLQDGTPTERRGFGFYVHENGNDECRWNYWRENEQNVTEDKIENYLDTYDDFMGRQWRIAKVLATVALAAGFVLAVGTLAYACIAHIKPIRYSSGACAVSLVTFTQLVPLYVLLSPFCSDRDCQLGRSGIFAIVAGGLFFVSGFFFFCMKNYPGHVEEVRVEGQQEGQEDDALSEETVGLDGGKDEVTHRDDGHLSDEENH